MPSTDIWCYATDAFVTVQIKLFVCMEGFDRCVSSFVSFIFSLSYVLQGMGTKPTESKTVPRHKTLTRFPDTFEDSSPAFLFMSDYGCHE